MRTAPVIAGVLGALIAAAGHGHAVAQRPLMLPTTTVTDAPASDVPASEPAPNAPVAVDVSQVPEGAVLLVLPSLADGVAPVVSARATALARATAASLGYVALGDGQVSDAAAKAQMAYPPSPGDLWRATYAASAHRGLFIRVYAARGRYVIDVLGASLDGMGPYNCRGTSSEKDFDEVVTRCVGQALPQAATWRGYDKTPTEPEAAPAPAAAEAPRGTANWAFEEEEPEPLLNSHEPMTYRYRVSLGGEAAYGVSPESFYNQLMGARFDVRLTPELAMGVGVAYADLDGRSERVANVLPTIMIEDRIRVGGDRDISFPLRFTAGYLPDNGPVFRFSAGVLMPLGGGWELEFDLITPTFWILPNSTAVSFNFGAEVGFGF